MSPYPPPRYCAYVTIHSDQTYARCVAWAVHGSKFCRKHYHSYKESVTSPPMNADRRTALQNTVNQALDELAKLEARPEEPTQEEAFITFKKTYSTGYRTTQTYIYVAVRASSGCWYTSAQASPHRYPSWDALLDFIYEGQPVDNPPTIWVATDFEEVI